RSTGASRRTRNHGHYRRPYALVVEGVHAEGISRATSEVGERVHRRLRLSDGRAVEVEVVTVSVSHPLPQDRQARRRLLRDGDRSCLAWDPSRRRPCRRGLKRPREGHEGYERKRASTYATGGGFPHA